MSVATGSRVGGPGPGGPPNTLTGTLGRDNTLQSQLGGLANSMASMIGGVGGRFTSGTSILSGATSGNGSGLITPQGNGIRRVDRPVEADNDVNVPLMTKALPNGAQSAYEVGDFLWLHEPAKDVADNQYTAMSLQVINDQLERAYLEKASRGRPASTALGKRAAGASSFAESQEAEAMGVSPGATFNVNFPTTIAEFREQFHYYGSIYTTNNSQPARERLFAMKFHGRLRVFNYWPGAMQGDVVGWAVKQYSNPYVVQYDYQGIRIGDSSAGQFLQIRPMLLRECNYPLLCSKADRPEERDLCCHEEVTVRGRLYAETDGGILDLRREISAGNAASIVTYPQYTEGIFIPAGVVFLADRSPPTQEEVNLAVRSTTDARRFAKNHSIELYFMGGKTLDKNLV